MRNKKGISGEKLRQGENGQSRRRVNYNQNILVFFFFIFFRIYYMRKTPFSIKEKRKSKKIDYLEYFNKMYLYNDYIYIYRVNIFTYHMKLCLAQLISVCSNKFESQR